MPPRATWVPPRAALALMFSCFVFMFGATTVNAVWTELLLQRACARALPPIVYPSKACDREGQNETTLRGTWMILAQTVPAALSIGAVASLSDAKGRRPAVILSFAGPLMFALSTLLTPPLVCAGGHCVDGYWIILAATFVSSFSGGGPATFSCAMSVIADVSDGWDARARTQLFMFLEAAMWGGAILGPVAGGKFAKMVGLRQSFILSVGAISLAIVLLLLLYPETLQPHKRKPFSMATANPVAQLFPLFSHPVLRRFAIVIGPTTGIAWAMNSAISNLYLIRVADLSLMELSIGSSINVAATVGGLVLGLPLLQRCFSTRNLIIFSIADSLMAQLLMGCLALGFWAKFTMLQDGAHGGGSSSFSGGHEDYDGQSGSGGGAPPAETNSWRYLGPYILMGVSALQANCMPCMRSTIAVLCETGECPHTVSLTLGALGALQSITNIVGPIIAPIVWYQTQKFMPQFVMFLCAGLTALGVLTLLTLQPLEPLERKAAEAEAAGVASTTSVGSDVDNDVMDAAADALVPSGNTLMDGAGGFHEPLLGEPRSSSDLMSLRDNRGSIQGPGRFNTK